MNLYSLLKEREQTERPVRVGVIGAGKFASMFFSQIPTTPGIHLVAVVDLDEERARASLTRTGWQPEDYAATSTQDAIRSGRTYLTTDAGELFACEKIEVVVEVTGNPIAGTQHALRSIEAGKHIVMVNVEADAFVGPLLREKAEAAGVVYSLAYGDQPALVHEMVDWARAIGLKVVAAGKGTKYLPEYRKSTPETVWDHYGFTDEQLANGDYNPKMFNSFLDGTKSAIEMAALANATGLAVPEEGLGFPPVGALELAQQLRPKEVGGLLERSGMVEVISSLHRDGTEVDNDLRWGVYVTFEAPNDYAAGCFAEYGLQTDDSGRFGALYRPYHLIGLELGVSVANIAVRGEATGQPMDFVGDVAVRAKRDLRAGDELDGEGGYLVGGEAIPARRSLEIGALPLGLAGGGTKLLRDVAEGEIIRWDDVEVPSDNEAVRVRKELEERWGQRLLG